MGSYIKQRDTRRCSVMTVLKMMWIAGRCCGFHDSTDGDGRSDGDDYRDDFDDVQDEDENKQAHSAIA